MPRTCVGKCEIKHTFSDSTTIYRRYLQPVAQQDPYASKWIYLVSGTFWGKCMLWGDTCRRHKGFTLVELMITLAIAAILLALAAPGFRSLIERNRLQSAASNLYASLMLARSEALKRNQPVGVCKGTATASAASCTTTGTDGFWEGGWLVHLDPNNPSTLDPNDVLATRLALKGGDTLRVVKTSATGTKFNGITYRPDGGSSGDASFILCNSDGDTSTRRLITLEFTGRPKLSQTAGSCSP